MKTSRIYHLSFNKNGNLELRASSPKTAKPKIATNHVEAMALFKKWNDDNILMCSSSIDFPKEYTTNKELIDFCDRLRGSK